jgi:hypothetical protein
MRFVPNASSHHFHRALNIGGTYRIGKVASTCHLLEGFARAPRIIAAVSDQKVLTEET